MSSTITEGARPDDARRHNRGAVLRRLHLDGPCTRAVLATELGLNRSTIKAVVDGLADSGLVSERLPSRRSGAGRPSLLVVPSPQAALVLAVDIRVDRVAMALFGLGGEILGRLSWRLRPGAAVPRDVVTGVLESAVVLASELSLPVVAAGVSVPGVVRHSDGLVRDAPHLGWVDVPLGEQLAAGLRMPVSVANDAELGALAEQTRGVARGVADMMFVAGDVGVGGGVILGGRAIRGASGYLGELGHMVVRPDGRECHCGCRGCWETEVGANALCRALNLPLNIGRGELYAELRELAADPANALDRLADYTSWLGLGLVNVVNLLAPRLVVLGDLFAALPEPVLEVVATRVRERSIVSRAIEYTEVARSTLSRDAHLVGAAEAAFSPILEAAVS
ncbi:MAG TPA: ROK family transcriptional regulator [Pseudonocardia sp.]|uniref:ROK family transcriptional regulator n=1 Tax=Pseudonocardia sp. TaxID=60912 RepID=UPI002B51B10C|nr:ROK family transcriptional regulator [Pseudonocardia sp.]HTF52219.1 ROK family transcriptional regulator [Pseudonocardia sp.]